MMSDRHREHHPEDRFGLLLVLLSTSFLLASVDGDGAVHAAVAGLNTLVLIVAFRATGHGQTLSRLAVLAAAGIAALFATVFSDPTEIGGGIAWLAQAAILSAVIVVIVRRVLSHDEVVLQTILGAVCVYVLIGLIFGVVYGAVDSFIDEPALFSTGGGQADPLYYSFVTLTTVGFGDVTSTIEIVRRITIVEAIIGQIFLATMIARLVSLYGVKRSDR